MWKRIKEIFNTIWVKEADGNMWNRLMINIYTHNAGGLGVCTSSQCASYQLAITCLGLESWTLWYIRQVLGVRDKYVCSMGRGQMACQAKV